MGLEAAVGPHCELSSGPTVAHPPHRLLQEVAPAGSRRHRGRCWPGPRADWTSAPRRCRRRSRAAGDSHGRRYSRGGALPLWPVHRSRRWSKPGRWSKAHRRVRPRRPMRVPATGGSPGRVDGRAPAEAAQEGAQGGWSLDHAAENTDRPTGTQRIRVVDAVAARQRGGDQRQQLVLRVGPPRRAAEVEVTVDDFPQAQVPGECGRQEQAALATRRWSSKTMRIRPGLFCGSILYPDFGPRQ